MKVALLLSGKFRGSYIPFNSLEKNFINKYNPDIFIHYSYKDENDMECFEEELKSLYNPKLIKYEKTSPLVQNYIDMVKNYPKAIENNFFSIFIMWYGIYEANKLKKQYEEINGFKYDIVLRTRFDIEFIEEVNLKLWNNSLFIPIGHDHRGGVNDLLAYGSSHTMDYYCSLFNFLVDYIKQGELMHAETLLKKHLLKLKDTHFIRTHLPIKLRGVTATELDYSMLP